MRRIGMISELVLSSAFGIMPARAEDIDCAKALIERYGET